MKPDPESIAAQLDATGLLCPEPVMMLHNKINDIAPGEVLEVIATDPSTRRDIPRFCDFLEHELLWSEESDKRFLFYIRKSAGPVSDGN